MPLSKCRKEVENTAAHNNQLLSKLRVQIDWFDYKRQSAKHLNQRWLPKLRIAAILIALLLGVYALSYRGVPISDDEELFASVARNIAVTGEWNASQIYGNTRLGGHYDDVGPFHILIGSFLYRLIEPSNLGGVQVLFLTTPVYTAVTAGLIFIFALRLGFSPKTGGIAAIIFGMGTIAWPYAQTLYREPLAALLLLGAWYGFTMAGDKTSSPSARRVYGGGGIILYGAALLTEFVLIVLLPVFIVAFLCQKSLKKFCSLGISGVRPVCGGALRVKPGKHHHISPSSHEILKNQKFFEDKWHWGAVTLLLLVGITGVWAIQKSYFDFYRFSLLFLRREFLARVIYSSHNHFWGAIVGSLFSPGKGLFLVSPVLLLSLFTLFKYWRSQKRIILIPWTSLLILIVIRALTFDTEWWDVTWGTRFLLPVIPMLVISILPLLDNLLASKKRAVWLGIGFLIGLSIIIQTSNVFVNPQTHNVFLYRQMLQPYEGAAIWDWRYSPLSRNWIALFSGNWDLALRFSFQESPLLSSLLVLLGGMLVLISGFILWRRLMRGSSNIQNLPQVIFLVSLIIVLPWLILHTFRSDPRYYASRADLEAVNSFLSKNVQPDDVLVLHAYLYPSWQHLMNFGRLSAAWYSLPLDIQSDYQFEGGSEIDLATRNLFEELADNHHGHIWFMTEDLELRSEEIYLHERYTRLQTWEFSGSSQVRLNVYAIP